MANWAELAALWLGGDGEKWIAENPCCLSGVVDWWTVDDAARKDGLHKWSTDRLGGVLCGGVAAVMEDSGSTVVEVREAETAAGKLLGEQVDWSSGWNGLQDAGLVEVVDGRVQLRWMTRAESELGQGLRRLAARAFGPPSQKSVVAAMKRLDFELSQAQQQAATVALSAGVSVLCGGPGTGKTASVRLAVELAEDAGERVALAAPTHRSAGRLSEVTRRPTSTVHALLGARSDYSFCVQEVDADLVVVDEASLLDTVLTRALVERLRPSARLLLVGDVEQLGSVGPGDVLRDVIRSGVCTVTELQECYRQRARSGIVDFVRGVMQGRVGQLPGIMYKPDKDVHFENADTVEDVDDVAVDLLLQGYDIITPRRSGKFGADQMSQRLRERAYNRTGCIEAGDYVRLKQSGYSWRGSSGNNIGRVVSRKGPYGYRTATVDFCGLKIDFAERDWNQLVMAIANTVHASQGLEYPEVALLLHPSAGRLLNRKVLYTAATRAMSTLVIFGDEKSLEAAARNAGEPRVTRLRELLQR